MRCNRNHLRIMKWVEEDGVLNRPNSNEEYSIRVESCYFRRYYRLNESNHFSVEIDALGKEEICVYEDCVGEDVRYQVDGVEQENGCVDFEDCDFHEVYIINKGHSGDDRGTLHLKKQVFNACGEQVDTNIAFVIEVVGESYTREIILNENNQYEMMVTSLPYGTYEVREAVQENFDTMYEVNGIESVNGYITIDQPMQKMYINNYQNDGLHMLRIDKWIQNGDGLVKPQYPARYEIVLQDQYAMREYTLECKNHYALSLEGNRYDCFSLEERNASNVIYEVDGMMVERVEVCMDKDHEVRIINIEDENEYGRIIVQKWVEEEGRLHLPPSQENFQINIYGYSDMEYTLNYANRFNLTFDDVLEGDYQIEEARNHNYEVSYEINGMHNLDGRFHVDKNKTVRVNIMNHKRHDGDKNIHIEKRVVDENGQLILPTQGSYEVEIKGNDSAQTIILDHSNHYEMEVHLASGWYTVREVSPLSNVVYRLDGVDQGNVLVFYVDAQKHEIVVMNLNQQINYIL